MARSGRTLSVSPLAFRDRLFALRSATTRTAGVQLMALVDTSSFLDCGLFQRNAIAAHPGRPKSYCYLDWPRKPAIPGCGSQRWLGCLCARRVGQHQHRFIALSQSDDRLGSPSTALSSPHPGFGEQPGAIADWSNRFCGNNTRS